MNIFVHNPETVDLERTFLSRSTAIGAINFPVKNSNKFAQDQKVMIGEMGNERTEILTVASVTNTQVTTDAAKFPHDADDPIYILEVDKVRIYRATAIGGVYSLLDTIDIDVDNENNKTVYDDTTALTTYFYKVSFYDSVNDEETELTEPIAATGYVARAVGSIITEVANEVKDPEFLTMAIPEYLSHMNNISDDLITQAKRPYRFLKRKASLDIDADASAIDFPDDFWKINYVEVNEVGPAASRTFRPKKVSATEARYLLTQSSTPGDYVDAIAFDDEASQMLVVPAARLERLGAFNFFYYKTFDRITSLSDVVETPNPLVYKLGLKREFYMLKADDDMKYMRKADEYDKKYNTEVMKLQREKSILASGPESMAPDRKRYPQWGGRRYRQ